MIRKLMVTLAGIGVSYALAFAANPPGTGQPNQECADFGTHPGHSASAPGSPFNENGVAGTKYAGTQPQNSKNPHSNSQYDVACFQQFQRQSDPVAPTGSHIASNGHGHQR